MQKNLKWKYLLIIAIIGLSIYSMYPLGQKINLGLDLKGGTHLVLLVDISKLPKEAQKDAADRVKEIISNRIDKFGVTEPIVQRQGTDRVIVQLPGITDRDRAISIVKQTALLEFKLVSEDKEKMQAAEAGNVPEGYELVADKDGRAILVEKEGGLTGTVLADASQDFGEYTQAEVRFTLTGEGSKKFYRLTRDNIGRRLAIILDGKLISAPTIQSAISDSGRITGNFTLDDAKDLALVLKSGALPAPVIIEEERTVGPALGRDSIQKGIRAALIGTGLVILFMAGYYFLSGLISDVALVLNLVILLGILAYPPLGASLTLPGIAGIALTLGMAVDANVLINERIREELQLGKHLRSAISAGYKRAFITIWDSQFTTLITAIILFIFGTGPVKGFATTLSIGIIVGLFTAIYVTRIIFDTLSLNKGFTKLHMAKIIKETKIDFVKLRKFAYLISIIFIIIGMTVFTMKGKKNLGIEFTGGSFAQFEFKNPVSAQQVRNALSEIGLGGATIQDFDKGKGVIVKTPTDTSREVQKLFQEKFKDNEATLMTVEKIGPIVGKELARKGFYSILLSLLGICIYVGFRFEFKWAVASIIALVHDTLVCLGAIALTGREVSLPVLAALLTMIGYSINDTIVIFDRMRENARTMRKATFAEVMNISINQTLRRTILTSFTVFLVLLSLYFLGGKAINDFAFVFLVGVITGTYSSVCVASPLILDWPGRKVHKK